MYINIQKYMIIFFWIFISLFILHGFENSAFNVSLKYCNQTATRALIQYEDAISLV